MKTVIVTFAFLFSSLSLFAEEEKIILNKAELNRDQRSIIYEPIAIHDGNLLYIYVAQLIENCQITVTDTNGQIVFTETATLVPEQPYIFSIDTINKGRYWLEIIEGGNSYRGSFETI